MSLDGLPSEILLRILQYLPFDERVRIARVNHQFKLLSEKVTSQTKSIDLTAPIFRRITTESMAKMIDLFAGNLEKVIFKDSWWHKEMARETFYDENGSKGTFIQFLRRNCPNLNHFDLRAVITLQDIDILRRVNSHSLKSLILDYYGDISNRFLRNISVAFPQLERLELITYSKFDLQIKSQGMKYLENLKHLLFFKIVCKYPQSADLDTNAMAMIGCKCVHIVEFRYQLNPTTIHAFTRHCNQLRQLIVQNIRGIDSPKSASDFVLSLADFVQENLSIMIKNGDSEIWKCQEVELAITEINKSGNRLSIDIPVMVSNMDDVKIFYPSPPSSQKRWYQNLIDWFLRLFRSIFWQ